MAEKKKYTYEDLENELKVLTPEQKKRQVIIWREDEGIRVIGLHNDPQPYYISKEVPEDGVISESDYNSFNKEEREDYEMSNPDGVTVLCADF